MSRYLGITIQQTKHGAPGVEVTLKAGVYVELTPADNLPADSPIKWWAHECRLDVRHAWPIRLLRVAETIGVGLHAGDVRIVEDMDRAAARSMLDRAFG